MKKLFFVLMLLVAQQCVARSGYTWMETYDLVEACNAKQSAECIAYVVGIAELISAYDLDGFHACYDHVNPGQLRAVVRKYLNDHPERWHFSAVQLTMEALSKAFPCRGAKS